MNILQRYLNNRRKRKHAEIADAWIDDPEHVAQELEQSTEPVERFRLLTALAQYWFLKDDRDQAKKYIDQAEELLPDLVDVPEFDDVPATRVWQLSLSIPPRFERIEQVKRTGLDRFTARLALLRQAL